MLFHVFLSECVISMNIICGIICARDFGNWNSEWEMASFPDYTFSATEITNMYTALRLSQVSPCERNEDGIPIKKIHVTNLQFQTTKNDLLDCFEQFGCIKTCTLHYNHSTLKYAFVTFNEVAQASRALSSKVVLKGKHLAISPAHSWHQPRDYKKQEKRPEKDDNKTQDENLPSCSQVESLSDDSPYENTILEILNHDCIMKIFSNLHIKYLIRSERVSKKWRALVEDKLMSMRIFKTSSWAETNNVPLTTNTLRTLLIKFGASLRRLHLDYQWSILNERTPQIISRYCPNLTEIILTSITARNWRPLFEKCTKLKSLSIICCDELEDRDFIHLKSQLEELTIVNSEELNGKFLTLIDVTLLKKLVLNKCSLVINKPFCDVFSKMKNLKTLCLDYSACFCMSDLKTVLASVPQLTEFSVCYFNSVLLIELEAIALLKELRVLLLSKNVSVTNNVLKVIVKGCPKLNTLDISNWRNSATSAVSDEGISHVWKLPQLEVLGTSGLKITDRAFDQVGINECGSKLRSLVCRHNVEITNSALVRLVQLCPKITKIDAYGCSNVNEEFVKSASQAVMLHPNRTEKLLVHLAHVDMLTEKAQEVIQSIKCPLLRVETTEDFCDPLLRSYKNCCDYNEMRDSDDMQEGSDDFDDLSDMSADDLDYSWDADDMFLEQDFDDSLHDVFDGLLPVLMLPDRWNAFNK